MRIWNPDFNALENIIFLSVSLSRIDTETSRTRILSNHLSINLFGGLVQCFEKTNLTPSKILLKYSAMFCIFKKVFEVNKE